MAFTPRTKARASCACGGRAQGARGAPVSRAHVRAGLDVACAPSAGTRTLRSTCSNSSQVPELCQLSHQLQQLSNLSLSSNLNSAVCIYDVDRGAACATTLPCAARPATPAHAHATLVPTDRPRCPIHCVAGSSGPISLRCDTAKYTVAHVRRAAPMTFPQPYSRAALLPHLHTPPWGLPTGWIERSA